MRRAAAVDGNQNAIVNALRDIGATVQHLHQVGHGCPDLLVGFAGRTYLLEVKDGTKPPSERCLTSLQTEWFSYWRGRPVTVVYSVADALVAVGAVSQSKEGEHNA